MKRAPEVLILFLSGLMHGLLIAAIVAACTSLRGSQTDMPFQWLLIIPGLAALVGDASGGVWVFLRARRMSMDRLAAGAWAAASAAIGLILSFLILLSFPLVSQLSEVFFVVYMGLPVVIGGVVAPLLVRHSMARGWTRS